MSVKEINYEIPIQSRIALKSTPEGLTFGISANIGENICSCLSEKNENDSTLLLALHLIYFHGHINYFRHFIEKTIIDIPCGRDLFIDLTPVEEKVKNILEHAFSDFHKKGLDKSKTEKDVMNLLDKLINSENPAREFEKVLEGLRTEIKDIISE